MGCLVDSIHNCFKGKETTSLQLTVDMPRKQNMIAANDKYSKNNTDYLSTNKNSPRSPKTSVIIKIELNFNKIATTKVALGNGVTEIPKWRLHFTPRITPRTRISIYL